jgi:hypothetical protein
MGQYLLYCRGLAVADPEFTRCDAGRSDFDIDERLFPRVSGSSSKYPANTLCEVGYNPRLQVTGIRAAFVETLR